MDSTLQTLHKIDNTENADVHNCTPDEFINTIKINPLDFTIISQNIRSIYSNIDDLLLNLANLKIKTDMIILTECRLNKNKNIPHIKNFQSYYTTNHLNKADGVTTYIKNSHKTIVEEIRLTHASCLQIKICPDLLILAIYRSPSTLNADEFINSLSDHLTTISSTKNIIITGDININLIYNNNEQSYDRSNRNNYLNMLAMHGLLPGHSLRTRGNSCLDHFIIKLDTLSKTATIAIIHTTITDHFTIFLKISKQKCLLNKLKINTTINLESALEYLKKIKP